MKQVRWRKWETLSARCLLLPSPFLETPPPGVFVALLYMYGYAHDGNPSCPRDTKA